MIDGDGSDDNGKVNSNGEFWAVYYVYWGTKPFPN